MVPGGLKAPPGEPLPDPDRRGWFRGGSGVVPILGTTFTDGLDELENGRLPWPIVPALGRLVDLVRRRLGMVDEVLVDEGENGSSIASKRIERVRPSQAMRYSNGGAASASRCSLSARSLQELHEIAVGLATSD